MKSIFVASVLIAAALAVQKLYTEEEDEIYDEFMRKHPPMLSTIPSELLALKANLLSNYYLCAKNNEKFERGESTFKMELHEFSTFNYEKLVKTRMGFVESPTLRAAEVPPACRTRSIPASFNWAEARVVTPVKDQRNCGSCWIFGSIAAIESAVAIKYGKLMKLSEQELLECITDPTSTGYAGCRGGGDTWVYNHLKNVGGVTMEYNYGYAANDKIQCSHSSRVKVPESNVVDFVRLTSGDEENLKYHLATVGPIAVAIHMSESMASYSYGIFNDTAGECGNKLSNHLVLLVGYGSTPCNGKSSCDYWILKNSWGPDWGQAGYFRLMRNRSNMCNIATFAKFPIV